MQRQIVWLALLHGGRVSKRKIAAFLGVHVRSTAMSSALRSLRESHLVERPGQWWDIEKKEYVVGVVSRFDSDIIVRRDVIEGVDGDAVLKFVRSRYPRFLEEFLTDVTRCRLKVTIDGIADSRDQDAESPG